MEGNVFDAAMKCCQQQLAANRIAAASNPPSFTTVTSSITTSNPVSKFVIHNFISYVITADILLLVCNSGNNVPLDDDHKYTLRCSKPETLPNLDFNNRSTSRSSSQRE